jgi:hypothetical protein
VQGLARRECRRVEELHVLGVADGEEGAIGADLQKVTKTFDRGSVERVRRESAGVHLLVGRDVVDGERRWQGAFRLGDFLTPQPVETATITAQRNRPRRRRTHVDPMNGLFRRRQIPHPHGARGVVDRPAERHGEVSTVVAVVEVADVDGWLGEPTEPDRGIVEG